MVTNNNIYVNNESSNSVSAIDAATFTNIANVSTAPGISPFYIQMSPDGLTVVVVNVSNEYATFIDTGTNVATTVAVTTPGLAVTSLSITADNKYVVFGNNQAAVIVVDLVTKAIVTTLTIPGPGSVSQYMVTSSDAKTAYDVRQSDVTVVDLTTLSLVTSTALTTSNHLSAIMNKGDTKLYVFDESAGIIIGFDTATNTVTSSVPTVTNPAYACINSTGSTLYITDQTGLLEYDTATDTITFSTVGLGTTAFFPAIRNDDAIVEFGSFNAGTGNVYFYDTAAHSVTSTFHAFSRVASCTASEDGNFFYAVFTDNQELAVFDSHAFTLSASPFVQNNPRFATSGFTGFVPPPVTLTIPNLFIPRKGLTSYDESDYMIDWLALERWANSWAPTLFIPHKPQLRTPTREELTANWVEIEVWAGSTAKEAMTAGGSTKWVPLFIPRKNTDDPDDLTADWVGIQNWGTNLR